MADDGVLFDKPSAQRIGTAVREVEGWPRNQVGAQGNPSHFRQPETIWAIITSQGTGDDDFKYAWQERRPLADGTWESPTDPRSGTLSVQPAINPNPDAQLDVVDKIVVLKRCQYFRDADTAADPPVEEDWLLAWGIVGAGAPPVTIDARQADDLSAEDIAFLNIGTDYNTDQILAPSPQTITPPGGVAEDGAELTFTNPGSDDYKVLQVQGGNVVWDYVRAAP